MKVALSPVLRGLLAFACVLLLLSPDVLAAKRVPRIKPAVSVSAISCENTDPKGPATFKYDVAVEVDGTAPLDFIVIPSAHCSLAGKVCRGVTCTTPCTGSCKVTLGQCQTGIASWVQVYTRDKRYVSNRVNAPAPDCGKPARK